MKETAPSKHQVLEQKKKIALPIPERELVGLFLFLAEELLPSTLWLIWV